MRVFSDLHLEFEDFILPPAKGQDVLILAGDIAPLKHRRLAPFLARAADMHEHVIYVAGNHEFYHNEFPDAWEELEVPSNVYKLEQERIVIDGQGYCGATLWTDLSNPMDEMIAHGGMWDYRAILGYVTPFTFTKVHFQTIDFLKQYVQPGDVVVTHHLPTYASVNKRFRGDPLNCAFATENYELIEELKPSVWVHGHSHDPCDYVLGATRVLSNPKGYYDENQFFTRDGYV